jgi:hypothetical protein
MLMTGREVEADQLLAMGGDAVAAIIAAGCGYPADDKAESVAAKLSARCTGGPPHGHLALDATGGCRPFRGETDGTWGNSSRRRRSIRYGAGFEIAEAIDALIGANSPPSDVWMTAPDRGRALFCEAAQATRSGAQLSLGTLAARGEPREVKRQLVQLQRE